MRKETLELDEKFGKEYAGHYVFSEISWAKRSRIIQKHTRYNQQTGQVSTSDYVAIQAETIIASLKEQPQHKPVTIEKLLGEEDGVPVELGELFSQTVNRLNTISIDEGCFLSAQSEDKNLIQPSQTSGSAKSSGGPQANSQNSQPKPSSNSSQS